MVNPGQPHLHLRHRDGDEEHHGDFLDGGGGDGDGDGGGISVEKELQSHRGGDDVRILVILESIANYFVMCRVTSTES